MCVGSGMVVQYTLNGTTWVTATGWTLSPSYSYTITTAGVISNSEQRYTPFGSSRLSASGLPTNRRFNGMKEEATLGGIYDFNARFGVYPERSVGIPRSGGS
jgi:hypothetical protein